MDKKKTSKKLKNYSSNIPKRQNKTVVLKKENILRDYNPLHNLLDVDKMGAAIMQCFLENDTEGVLDIVENYLYAVNKR